MIQFDKVELLTENRPHKCLITLFENINLNGRWVGNSNFAESWEFAENCADFEQRSRSEKQRMMGVWVYVLHAPYKYRDIPCIGKVLPKLDQTRKHKQKPVSYDDLVADECRG